jgi:hypothetical protein
MRWEDETMSEKTFKIVGNDISDGYHTFDELYEHRCLLFLAWLSSDGQPANTYWVADHFEGWDLVVTHLRGFQISYHVPIKYRRITEALPKREIADHNWDGHTSANVIARLINWCETA